jgi:hypothetical protein
MRRSPAADTGVSRGKKYRPGGLTFHGLCCALGCRGRLKCLGSTWKGGRQTIALVRGELGVKHPLACLLIHGSVELSLLLIVARFLQRELLVRTVPQTQAAVVAACERKVAVAAHSQRPDFSEMRLEC